MNTKQAKGSNTTDDRSPGLLLVGSRIRQLRQEYDIKQSELAEACDITVAYISQIERNLIEPSLPVLRKIAKALKTETSMFFADEIPSDILVTRHDQQQLTGLGQIEYRFMMPAKLKRGTKVDMSAMIAIHKPNTEAEAETLIHTGAEFNTVLSGEMVYLVGEERYHLEEGDSIYLAAHTEHKVFNPGLHQCVSLAAIVSAE